MKSLVCLYDDSSVKNLNTTVTFNNKFCMNQPYLPKGTLISVITQIPRDRIITFRLNNSFRHVCFF